VPGRVRRSFQMAFENSVKPRKTGFENGSRCA
jgi:hypothetical protein